MRLDPIIFIPDESNNPLEEVLVEKYENFDIFWYHWSKDGPDWFHFVFREEDYEPVIVVYCNDDVICVITRAHWDYQHNDILEMKLVTPCQVVFEDQWHPALPKTLQNEREFELKKVELLHKEYSATEIEKKDILEKFRIGKDHDTNLKRKIMDDPFDVAQAAYEHYCLKMFDKII